MSERSDLVSRLIDCYNRRDADGLESLLHLDARYTAMGSDLSTDIVGRYQIIEYFKRLVFTTVDRLDVKVLHQWEDRERSVVIVEWRSDVWPQGSLKYENAGVFVVEIANDLVSWVREYSDTEKMHPEINRAGEAT